MDDLSPKEEAHIAPGGPALAGASWFSAVVDQVDLAAAWELTDEPLRLAAVQSWLEAVGRGTEPDRDEVAEALAEGPGHADWPEFAAWRVERWRSGKFKMFVDEGWGLLTLPELVGPDLELVRLAPGREGRELETGEPVRVLTLTVRLVASKWLVAGIGRNLAVPGWPPTTAQVS